MPHQDAYGRWVSDDGALYWDGRAWQPLNAVAGYGAYPTAPVGYGRSAKGGVALGFGIASMVAWLLPIAGLPISITAVVVGILSLRTSSRTLGRVGLILGAIGLVLTIINSALGVYFALNKNT